MDRFADRLCDKEGRSVAVDYIEPCPHGSSEMAQLLRQVNIEPVCAGCRHAVLEECREVSPWESGEWVAWVSWRHTVTCTNYHVCPDHPSYDPQLALLSKDDIEVIKLIEEVERDAQLAGTDAGKFS